MSHGAHTPRTVTVELTTGDIHHFENVVTPVWIDGHFVEFQQEDGDKKYKHLFARDKVVGIQEEMPK